MRKLSYDRPAFLPVSPSSSSSRPNSADTSSARSLSSEYHNGDRSPSYFGTLCTPTRLQYNKSTMAAPSIHSLATPGASPSVLKPYSSYSHDFAFAPAPPSPPTPPPSPPTMSSSTAPQRISALAQFAAESFTWLWFAPAPAASGELQRPTKQQLVPSDRFMRFCHDVLATTQVSHSIVIVALLFIQRLKSRNPIRGEPGSEFRLAITALMMANKILDDNTYTARTWSDVSSLDLKPLVAGEAEFLRGIDFELHVSHSDYLGWVKLLEGHIASRKAHVAASSARKMAPLPARAVAKQESPELLGLGFSTGFTFGAQPQQHNPESLSHAAPPPLRQRQFPTPNLNGFSFPPTPLSAQLPSCSAFPYPASQGCSPLSRPAMAPPLGPPRPFPRVAGGRQSHIRSVSDVHRPALPPPPVPHHISSSSSNAFPHTSSRKRSAGNNPPEDRYAKRAAAAAAAGPASTWISRSFSAGASPAPPRSVYVMPRPAPSTYTIHPSHFSPHSRSPLSEEYLSPAPPSDPRFAHLAHSYRPTYSPSTHAKPDSLSFYSLAAGQGHGLPRKTSVHSEAIFDPYPQARYTPAANWAPSFGTPKEMSSPVDFGHPGHCGAQQFQQRAVYSTYANAGEPGVLWSGSRY